MVKPNPKWIQMRYAALYSEFGATAFTLEKAIQILNEKKEVCVVILSRLKRSGWLTITLNEYDSRRKNYSLIKPEEATIQMHQKGVDKEESLTPEPEIADLEKGEISLNIVQDASYSTEIITLTKQLAENHKSVCYVSLNRPYLTLIKGFDDNKIDINKFLFIDAVTKPSEQKEIKNCIFISSVVALTELSIAITKALEKGKFESLILDSLSTMLIHHDAAIVTKFVHNLIGKLRKVHCTAVLTSLQGDVKSSLIKDLGMIVDKVIGMEK